MLFIYTERKGAKEYAIIRDGCQAQHVEGVIAEAYKAALGAPKFLWPDFFDRICYDANDAHELAGMGNANYGVEQFTRALSPEYDSKLFTGFRAAFRKFLKESK